MSVNWITGWTEEPRHDRIEAWKELQVLEPESIYPGWTNFVSQRSVRAIAISHKSRHMWLATWGGVLSWRQRQETTYFRYSSEHGLLGNGVSCVCVDEEERPWVGHEEGGLGYFDDNRWNVYPERKSEVFRVVTKSDAGGIWAATSRSVYRIQGPNQGSVPVPITKAVAEYPLTLLEDGNDLLLGTNQGLFRLNNIGELIDVEPERIRSCTSLSRDAQGRIWIGTATEVYLMEAGQVRPEPFYDGSAGYVKQLAAGRDLVWVLTTEGICVIDKSWKPVSFNSEQTVTPQAIAVSSSDRHLWVGTNSLLSSLYYSDDGSVTWDHSQLPEHREDQLSNLGRCITGVEDGDRTVCVGTVGGLVVFPSDDKWSINSLAGDVRDLCITSTANGKTFWMLRWPKGFWAKDLEFAQPPGIPIALARGLDGNAYGLTSRGLWLLGPILKQIAENPSARAHCLSQTQDGTWWAGTAEGVYSYKNGNWSVANEQPGPSLSEIYTVVAIGNKIWAAAANGLWSRTGNTWESHTRIVHALAVASDGTSLWMAEQDALVRYSPKTKKHDKLYSLEEHGIASRRMAAIAEIGGDLWVVTAAGVSRLRLNEEVI